LGQAASSVTGGFFIYQKPPNGSTGFAVEPFV